MKMKTLVSELQEAKDLIFKTVYAQQTNNQDCNVIVLTGKTVIIHQYDNYKHHVVEIEYKTKSKAKQEFEYFCNELEFNNIFIDNY